MTGVEALAAKLAFDFVSESMEAEADRYTASYESNGAFDQFWTHDDVTGSLVQRCFGVEMVRKVDGSDEPAATLVCAFLPSSDNSVFSIRPVLFRLDRAAAKILSYQLKDWYSTLWTWMLHTGSSVGVEVSIELNAVWVDAAQVVHQQQIASIDFPIAGVDLDKRSDVTKFASPVTWFPGVPVSVNRLTGEPDGNGTYTISIKVTEKDPSNAQDYLRKLAKSVRTKRDELTKSDHGKTEDPSPDSPAPPSASPFGR